MPATQTKVKPQVTVVEDRLEQTLLTAKQFRNLLIDMAIQDDSRPAFAAFDALYSMDDKGKMRKTGNPYSGKGVLKYATTSVLVNFDYAKAVERRTDGQETAKRGNWQQAVLVGGKLTPLSVHKADIKTELKADAQKSKSGKYAWSEYEAVLDDDGTVIFTADEPRCYLRCEYRSSESRYELDGSPLDSELIKPFLPDRSDGPVEHHTVSLDSVVAARINGRSYKIVEAA